MKHLPYWLTFATVMFFTIIFAATLAWLPAAIVVIFGMVIAGYLGETVQMQFTGHER